MKKLRVIVDWVEDFVFALYLVFHTPQHIKDAVKEGESESD